MAKKSEPAVDPIVAPLHLLKSLDREALERDVAAAEAELEQFVAERRQGIDGLKVLLKAARIRDGIAVRKKPTPRKPKGELATMAASTAAPSSAGNRLEDGETGGGVPSADMRGIALKLRSSVLRNGPQSLAALAKATGVAEPVIKAYVDRGSGVLMFDKSGWVRLAS